MSSFQGWIFIKHTFYSGLNTELSTFQRAGLEGFRCRSLWSLLRTRNVVIIFIAGHSQTCMFTLPPTTLTLLPPCSHSLPPHSPSSHHVHTPPTTLTHIHTHFRNSSLKEKLKSLKKKEAEDTKALEDMVLKVESNLVSTTVSNI